MNCEKCLSKCKAECCGAVPIPKKTYKKFPFIRKTTEFTEIGWLILATDKDDYCPYLNKELRCSIYNHRPDVCKKYGDESHLLMTCRWQDKQGKSRRRSERRSIEKIQSKEHNRVINKLKCSLNASKPKS